MFRIIQTVYTYRKNKYVQIVISAGGLTISSLKYLFTSPHKKYLTRIVFQLNFEIQTNRTHQYIMYLAEMSLRVFYVLTYNKYYLLILKILGFE